MEDIKKCSNKKHSAIDAISYCNECNLFLCNKCDNYHLELFDGHHLKNLNEKNKSIFINLCQESNHKIKLEYYCKSHNKLCCAACLSKIKGQGNGQHFGCEVCLIKEIEQEKKKILNENIKYLKETSEKIKSSINKLKEIYNNFNESKDKLKATIVNIFTKIRNLLNEREDELMKELDDIYENSYFKEEVIKKAEKLPSQINSVLEKGNLINKEWTDNDHIIEGINECINIENNIKNIIETNDIIEKYNTEKILIKFLPDNGQLGVLGENIIQFGTIIKEEKEEKNIKKEKENNVKEKNKNKKEKGKKKKEMKEIEANFIFEEKEEDKQEELKEEFEEEPEDETDWIEVKNNKNKKKFI